ncbi:hypothetical protein [Pelagicoccus sp. SDUM812003]|uniref:hypothetical protein n=1 Tax=Pelagicoccus sp. SDUM812003 TaxID=3041267 RepID=UPI00280F0336|nr:hypothetical protein [Pelagicoccus sp. SDUM812003]MDQ8201782.1 hypothetical protein [Pelagicoccus sp. SDUM812003]
MSLRPLGIAREIIDNTGLEVTYAYDDLLFVEHNPFIVQFDDDNLSNLKLFFNVECEEETATQLEIKLRQAASERKFTIANEGKYELVSEEGAKEFQVRYLS